MSDGRQLWSQQFDESFTDIFAVQDTIATRVTDALALRLTGQADRRLKRRYTQDAEAYQLYVNGWFQRTRPSEEGYRRSIEYFDQAIARDPNYPLPYVGLADSYAMLGVFGVLAPRETFPRALAAANKALELDNDLGEAHASLAHIMVQYERDLSGAGSEYQRALALAPDYAIAHMWYGLYLGWTGNLEEGHSRACERRKSSSRCSSPRAPTSGCCCTTHAATMKRSSNCARSWKWIPAWITREAFWAAAIYARETTAAAIEEFKRASPCPWAVMRILGWRWRLRVDGTKPSRELKSVLALSREKYVSATILRRFTPALARADQAFDSLERAIADQAQMLVLGVDPSFDGLRADPRMKALVERLGRKQE